jgi:hypothetical protein
MSFGISNAESNAELKKRAMDYILREICRKYKDTKDQTFTEEEIHTKLKGLGHQYLSLNIRDLLLGSGFIEIDDNLNLRLNDNGIKFCRKENF